MTRIPVTVTPRGVQLEAPARANVPQHRHARRVYGIGFGVGLSGAIAAEGRKQP